MTLLIKLKNLVHAARLSRAVLELGGFQTEGTQLIAPANPELNSTGHPGTYLPPAFSIPVCNLVTWQLRARSRRELS